MKKTKKLTKQLLEEWDYSRNKNLDPFSLSTGSHKKVWWICPNGHHYEMIVKDKVRSNMCPVCSGRRIVAGVNDFQTLKPLICSEWDYKKNSPLIPSEVAANSNKRVWWKCSKCGREWEATIAARTKHNSLNCYVCNREKSYTTKTLNKIKANGSLEEKYPKIASEWNYEKNGSLLPSMVTPHSHKKVWWRCSKCGKEWEAPIADRTTYNSLNCYVCNREKSYTTKTLNKIKANGSLEEKYPKIASEWNYEKNGSLLPSMVTPHSQKKVWWLGRCGHEWEATINNRVKGRGCPICSNRKVDAKLNSLASTHPDLAEEWHPTKNGDLRPQHFSKGSGKKVWWLGRCGHEWEATINNRVKGRGCPICSSREVDAKLNSLAITHPELANEWHPTKNGDLKPQFFTKGSSKKVWWLGKCGHEWQALIRGRAGGNGCPVCGQKTITQNRLNTFLKKYGSLQDIYPELAEEWHPTKNGDLKPSEVTSKSGKKVWWLGKCGHEWQATILNRAREQSGCPICSQGIQTSLPEQAIYYYVQQLFPNSLNSYKPSWLKGMEIDVFIPELRLGIEYDGVRWHQDIDKDIRKNNLILKHGIHLLRMRENGCPSLNDVDVIRVPVTKNQTISDMGQMIGDVLTYLKDYYNVDISKVKINFSADKNEILSRFNITKSENSLESLFPDIANEWHPTKNGNFSPSQITAGSTKKVWWKCKKGHEWLATPNSRTKRNSSCPYCSGHYKRIKCLETDVIYNSIAEASRNMGISKHIISNYLRGITKDGGGFHWIYVDDDFTFEKHD